MSHKETLTRHKVEILRTLSQHVIETGKNEVPLRILRNDINAYNNAQKLRYHGLIFQVRRGVWGITRNGWAFLRGDLDLPTFVRIENNHIVAWSDVKVNIRRVYQGSTEVVTTFEYFIGDQPVGLRPFEHAGRQVTLL